MDTDQREIFVVLQRHEDEGTDWGCVEIAFTTMSAAETYVEDWEDEHDDAFGELHSFFQDEDGETIPKEDRVLPDDYPNWCPTCREDRRIDVVILHGSLGDLAMSRTRQEKG